MPNIQRPLGGKALHFRLSEGHRSGFIDQDLLNRGGRSARTLVKEGPLRVTLVALAAGGALAEHSADGPITVHVLAGRLRFQAGGDEWMLESGDLLSLAAGVAHSVETTEGAEFLLSVVSTQPGE